MNSSQVRRTDTAGFDHPGDAWQQAQTSANRAYERWRANPQSRDAYARYRAEQDRADAAQDGLAQHCADGGQWDTARRGRTGRVGRRAGSGARVPKTATIVAQRIVNEITDEHLPVGTPLAPEREMLEHYGVARGTLREALRYLEIQGVITIRPGPGGGPTVNGVDPRSLASTISLMLQLGHAPFSTILEARQLLEPALAALAAQHATPHHLQQLQAAMDDMRDHIDDPTAFLTANQHFHTTIANAAGNQFFELLLQSLTWILDATAFGVDYDKRRRRHIINAHTPIHQAIQDHDPQAAQTAMATHINDFANYLNRHHASVLKRPLRWA